MGSSRIKLNNLIYIKNKIIGTILGFSAYSIIKKIYMEGMRIGEPCELAYENVG
ncbi:hypothetical protein [Crassaminicella indica]|uniref:Uncharacterized protein n=1 Tax=Crassaminicella indica TaxID=2855394 RepID=A0ABX8R967_9CLOT|nr:hypothetical protein [Crassaminicella indica]QXM05595.1 hypothetical protein KVH43_09445 [Crassaminicella indica]